MAKAIVHVGYPKTGSTWFQQCLYPYVSNWNYLHRDKFRKLVTDSLPFQFELDENGKRYFANSNTIVCDEGIIGGNPFIAAESLHRIKSVFEEVRIVLFIRNQPDMLVSKYSQYIYKNKGTESAKRFFGSDPYWHRVHNFQRFQPEYLYYHSVINYLNNLFGRSHVFVYLFEDFVENPKAFIDKFSLEHNIELKTNTLDFSSRNDGLRRGLYPILRFLNIFTRYNRRDKYYLIHIPYWHQLSLRIYQKLNGLAIFGRKPKLEQLIGKARAWRLIDFYRSSNELLVPLFGREKLEQYGYPLNNQN